MSDTSLAALLLTNRLVEVAAKPFSSGEYWALLSKVPDPSVLLDADLPTVIRLLCGTGSGAADSCETDALRVVRLLAAATAFAFARERLEEEGISLLSSFDERFPGRLRDRLDAACPPFLTVAGPIEWLSSGGLGVVGSRAAHPEALAVARSAAGLAARAGRVVVSGLARGIDQESMAGALDAGGPVVGIPSEGLRLAGRSPEVRRRVHSGELCIASPYGPDARFSAGNALGRNKIIFGLADVTFVVCADDGSGGTWGGSSEALRRGFGPVNVWMGAGQGAGNASLARLGGRAITEVAHAVLEVATPVQPHDATS
ncbi:MAG: hypothetical protein RLZZ623_2271 [Actinomycetota bacterium]